MALVDVHKTAKKIITGELNKQTLVHLPDFRSDAGEIPATEVIM
jgi:hypothetical protein